MHLNPERNEWHCKAIRKIAHVSEEPKKRFVG